MRIGGEAFRTIWPGSDAASVQIIDQTRLPHEFEIISIKTASEAARASSIHLRYIGQWLWGKSSAAPFRPAAGGDSVILANWVRRSERLALSENGDGTRAAAFAGARGSGRRRCTPMDTREGCGRPGEGMTTGSRHPTARNTFEPLQSGVPGPVG